MKIINKVIYNVSFDNWLTEHEYDYVLIWEYSWEKINPDITEVMEYKWINLKDLKSNIMNEPDIYTNGWR